MTHLVISFNPSSSTDPLTFGIGSTWQRFAVRCCSASEKMDSTKGVVCQVNLKDRTFDAVKWVPRYRFRLPGKTMPWVAIKGSRGPSANQKGILMAFSLPLSDRHQSSLAIWLSSWSKPLLVLPAASCEYPSRVLLFLIKDRCRWIAKLDGEYSQFTVFFTLFGQSDCQVATDNGNLWERMGTFNLFEKGLDGHKVVPETKGCCERNRWLNKVLYRRVYFYHYVL